MKYLLYMSSTYSPNNNLQKAIKQYLIKINRRYVDASELEQIKRAVLDQIASYNAEYKRCHPVAATWSGRYPGDIRHDDFYLDLGNCPVGNFYLLKCESVHARKDEFKILPQVDGMVMPMLNIYQDTKLEQVVEYLSRDVITGMDRELIHKTIERFVEVRVDQDTHERFAERLKKQSKEPSDNWHIAGHDMEIINDVADRLSAKDKANLMRIGYKEVMELKLMHERAIYGELIELLDKKLICRYYGEPMDLDSLLQTLDQPYTGENFKRLLKSHKIAQSRVDIVLAAVKEEYREINDEEEQYHD